MEKRDKLSSRLGFILISAGCAIGLGNVWRFPYITGQYGGAAFVLVYLLFLVILGLPIMVMEFSVGRASRKSAAKSFHVLEPKGSKWHLHGYAAVAGNYILLMFYTTVAGWMLDYVFKTASGKLSGQSPEAVGAIFDSVLASAGEMLLWTAVALIVTVIICSRGLQNGVEKITKVMMIFLLVILVTLCVKSLTLDKAMEGVKFYLVPDFGRMLDQGIGEVVFAAMGQSFFTLSLGIGSLAIFGSYIDKKRSLMGESINICALDTMVALLSGLIIFPACFSFNVEAGSGPGLVFVTLPNIFNQMSGGMIWGTLFFIFMSFAALSTLVAVFENILAFSSDLWGWKRKKAVVVNSILIFLTSIPCVLGFNKWSFITPLGEDSTIQSLEDFIVSNNLLPLGSLIYLLFCTSKYGWGWDKFIKEADIGKGVKFPKWGKLYFKYILPLIILFIFVMGYRQKFFV